MMSGPSILPGDGDDAVVTPPAAPPSASVVVLAYNAADVIIGCLVALQAQDFGTPFQTIVVWSGDARIPELVAQKFPDTAVVGQLQRLRTGAARNLGILHATGDIIAFLAADCRPAPDWLRQRVAAHRSGFRCVGGTVHLAEPAGIVARASHLLEYSDCLWGRPREVLRGRVANNLSFDRQIFAEYGLYEPTLACGEDSLFSTHLALGGESILFDPSIRIAHAGPGGIREYVAHQAWHGGAFARLVRDHGYGAHQRPVQRLAVFVRYPYRRLGGLTWRLLTFRRDLLVEALCLSPLLVLGVAACMVGIAREWWGHGTAA